LRKIYFEPIKLKIFADPHFKLSSYSSRYFD
jgi:hypothetical protein